MQGVWFSGAAEHHGLFYGALPAKEAGGQRHLGTDAAGHADIALDGRLVALAWKEPSPQATRLMATVSTDGGLTWHDNELASVAGPADHPRVLIRDHQAFVFWNTTERPLAVFPLSSR